MQNNAEDGDMIKINKRKFLGLALIALLIGILIGQGLAQAKPETYEDLKLFTQALELVKNKYVEDPKTRELIYGAIRGMLSSLDPHSSFMTERAYKEMDMDIRGEFQGVGIQIGVKKLVLDLRNDPGGMLDASVDVSSMFLPKDTLVVYLQGRNASERKDFLSSGSELYRQYPLVVLVNTGSASASEIVAGALQDSKRAAIVGTQTFGKGSVQTVYPLEGGVGLRLTTAKYYTPSGRSIQNVGITPDIEVKLPTVKDPKEGDSVHMILREKDLERHLKNDTVKEDHKKEQPAEEDLTLEMVPKDDKDDIQLQNAMKLLKPAVNASDVYKNVPVSAKKEKVTESQK